MASSQPGSRILVALVDADLEVERSSDQSVDGVQPLDFLLAEPELG